MISIGLNFDEGASFSDYIISLILMLICMTACVAVCLLLPIIGLFVVYALCLYFFVAHLALFVRRMNYRGKSRFHCLWLIAPIATGSIVKAAQTGIISPSLANAAGLVGLICSVIASCLALMVDVQKGEPHAIFKYVWNGLVVLFNLACVFLGFLGLLRMSHFSG